MECEFCKKNLSTLSNLNYHKKTNKSCQKIQLQIKDKNDIDSLLSPCEFCNKIFTFQTMKVHLNSCKKKKNFENGKDDEIKKLLEEKDDVINKLKNRIIELETENKIFSKDHDEIIKIANQPKTTNTNNRINVSNNFFNEPDKVKLLVESKLTKNHIIDGQKGVAHFAYDALLKDIDGNINYFCTDSSRHIFKFQNSDGELEKDIKATKLTNLLMDAGLKNKTGVIATDLWTNKDGTLNCDKFRIFNSQANEIILMQADNTVFRNELACLTSM